MSPRTVKPSFTTEHRLVKTSCLFSVFDRGDPLHPDGTPANGNTFVTQGYLYPAGTLGDGDSGVDGKGDPAWPELVNDGWTCHGVFVGDGV